MDKENPPRTPSRETYNKYPYYNLYMLYGDMQKNEERYALRFFIVVAGAGLEPATSGL